MNTLKIEKQRILDTMAKHEPDSPEYKECTCRLIDLENMTTYTISPTNPSIISAATSVLSLLLVLNFEKFGVITSKAFSLIKRN